MSRAKERKFLKYSQLFFRFLLQWRAMFATKDVDAAPLLELVPELIALCE